MEMFIIRSAYWIMSLVGLGITGYSITKIYHYKTIYFTFLSAIVFIVCFGYYVELTAATLHSSFVTSQLYTVILFFLGPTWVMFVIELFKIKRSTKKWLSLLFIIPTLALICYPFLHKSSIYFESIKFVQTSTISYLVIENGNFTRLNFANSILCIFVTIYLAINFHRKRINKSNLLGLSVVVTSLVTLILMITLKLLENKNKIDIMPALFVLGALYFSVHIYKLSLVDISIIAKETMIKKSTQAFLSVASDGTIISYNNTFANLYKDVNFSNSIVNVFEIHDFPWKNIIENNNYTFSLVRDGENYDYACQVTEIENESKSSYSNEKTYSAMIYDMTFRNKLLLKFETQSNRDELTGLSNRRYFYEAAEHEIDISVRNKTNISVGMIDIDFFKKINDNYGHLAGDYVIKTIAKLITERARKIDLICRYGGEEFCILFVNTEPKGVENACKEIKDLVEKFVFKFGEFSFRCTISIGISNGNSQKEFDLDKLISLADNALYISKESGRNKITVSNNSDE